MFKNTKNIFRYLAAPAAFVFFSFSASTAFATENGLGHYPVGVNTLAAGILPTPGEGEMATYSMYSNETYFAGPDGKGEIPGFDTSVSTFVPRVLYTLPETLTSLHLPVTVGAVFPLVNLNINMPGQPHGHILGLGDIDLETDIQFNSPRNGFFSYGGLVTYLPTGSYNQHRLANLGLNYYSFHPQYAMTWFPSRNLEIDNTISASFNTTNTATHYHSGANFYYEYAANYRFFPNLAPNLYIGAQGFVQDQFQNDTSDGAVYRNGFKSQAFGIGPQLTYYMFHNRGGLIAKYIHQYSVKNQGHGDEFWLELAVPLA